MYEAVQHAIMAAKSTSRSDQENIRESCDGLEHFDKKLISRMKTYDGEA
ncbi:hypothetical protein QG37_07463 [Candidozyma auris]|uniref:Uncharacterized protein n=1 Tax=Candidozyma auris TaxID=498019 RepID=A0A0L0NQ91_CANAR|nr:hypothetical protein QG37_07463 [[Candida] auris]